MIVANTVKGKGISFIEGQAGFHNAPVTEEQLQQSSEELASSPGARHGEILVRMGFLDQKKLGAAVRKQVQEILWSLFNWS